MNARSHDSLPVYELDRKYSLDTLDLSSLDKLDESHNDFSNVDREIGLSVGSLILPINIYRYGYVGYEAIRPYSSDEGYEFDSRDFDVNERKDKIKLTEKLNRRRAGRLGHSSVSEAVEIGFVIPTIAAEPLINTVKNTWRRVTIRIMRKKKHNPS